MHTYERFAAPDQRAIGSLVRDFPFALLVTPGADGHPVATHAPVTLPQGFDVDTSLEGVEMVGHMGRANAQLNETTLAGLCERNPNLVGFKDGVGDVELMTRVYAGLGDRLTYVGGLPTAETFALPYLEMGVTTYSSAIFNFLPEWALSFYDSVRRRDRDAVYAELKSFVLPYIAIRNRKRGYAVSMVKAGADLVGRGAGKVRSPLTELTGEEREELSQLIAANR